DYYCMIWYNNAYVFF
nr:immunoglobulin light chain junction region [Macaca mulatta]